MYNSRRRPADVITTWVAIFALGCSVVSLVLYCINTFPKASVEIISHNLCIDKRYLEEENFRDSVYLHLKFVNNSFRCPTSILSVKVDFEDPEDTLISAYQEFIERPEYMEPGKGTNCLIKLKLFRLGVGNYEYSLPLKVNQKHTLRQLKQYLGVVTMANLQHSVTLRFNITFVGGSKRTEFTTRRVYLIDVPE